MSPDGPEKAAKRAAKIIRFLGAYSAGEIAVARVAGRYPTPFRSAPNLIHSLDGATLERMALATLAQDDN